MVQKEQNKTSRKHLELSHTAIENANDTATMKQLDNLF